MAVSDLAEIVARLAPATLEIDCLLLDPNNPRLAEARGTVEPEECIDDPSVQEETFRRLKNDGIDDLRASIATAGFLPISMLVVRKHFKSGSDKFIIVEGNRRVAAIRWIMREAPPGMTGELLKKRRSQLRTLNVLNLDTDLKRLDADRLLLQGICHMSPVRTWPAYARALACYSLEKQGLTTTQIARALGGGISAIEVGRLLRAYYAYMQMVDDEEYGGYAAENRKLLSYFPEVVGRPRLRSWLDWDDSERKFANDENREILYNLLESGKLRRMTDVRLLPKILDYTPTTLDRLLTEPDFSIDEAYAHAVEIEQAQRAPPRVIAWRDYIRGTMGILERGVTLPFYNEDVSLLQTLIDLTQKRLEDIKRYLQAS